VLMPFDGHLKTWATERNFMRDKTWERKGLLGSGLQKNHASTLKEEPEALAGYWLGGNIQKENREVKKNVPLSTPALTPRSRTLCTTVMQFPIARKQKEKGMWGGEAESGEGRERKESRGEERMKNFHCL